MPGTRSREGWEWRPWGAQAGPSPSCFRLTRMNKLIISVVVIMGCPLLPTSPYEPVTFIIFMGILCGALMQRVLGDPLGKDSRNVKPSFSCLSLLFLEFMYYFSSVPFNVFPSLFFPAMYFLLCFFFLHLILSILCFLPPVLFAHIHNRRIKAQKYFRPPHSYALLNQLPCFLTTFSHL